MSNKGQILCIILAAICIPIIVICMILLAAGNAFIKQKESESHAAFEAVSQTDADRFEADLTETVAALPAVTEAVEQTEGIVLGAVQTEAVTETQAPVETAAAVQIETVALTPTENKAVSQKSMEISTGSNGTTILNVLNGGYVAGNDTNHFFRGSDGCLYSAENGSDTGVKLLDKTVCYLNVQGGWLYFKNVSDNCLARMRTDGTEYQVLIEGDIHEPYVYGSNLYYSTDRAVFRMNNNGTDPVQIISGTVWMLTVRDDGLFYVDTGNERTLYRSNLDGSDPQALLKGAYEIVVTDSKIYYTAVAEEHYLYAYDRSTGNTECIAERFVRWLNYDGSYFYFTNNAGKDSNGLTYGDTLFRCRTDGSECEQFIEDAMAGIYIQNGILYYADTNKTLHGVRIR